MKGRQNNNSSRPRRNQGFQGQRARVGLISAREMDFGGLGNVEWALFEEGVTLAPMSCDAPGTAPRSSLYVMPTADLGDIQTGKLAGLVAPGDSDPRNEETQARFDALVRAACDAGVPVMAFGQAVAPVLAAAGVAAPEDLPAGVVLDDGLRVLAAEAEVREAARAFHRVRSPRQAA